MVVILSEVLNVVKIPNMLGAFVIFCGERLVGERVIELFDRWELGFFEF